MKDQTIDKNLYNEFVSLYLSEKPNYYIRDKLNLSGAEFNALVMRLESRERNLRSKHSTYYALNAYCDSVQTERSHY